MASVNLLAKRGLLLAGVFCIVCTTMLAMKRGKTEGKKNSPKANVQIAKPEESKISVAKEVYFDASQHENDYNCVIWISEKQYSEALPGVKPDVLKNVSPSKWFFNVALFEGVNIKKVVSFPTSLVVSRDEYVHCKPSFVKFINRRKTASGLVDWDREILSIENGFLYKYNVWVGKDPETKKMKISVDLGKRIPLYVKGKLDDTYEPWADSTGSIYFKVAGVHYKWDVASESVRALQRLVQRKEIKGQLYKGAIQDGAVRVHADDSEFVVSANVNVETIDPLGINEDSMKQQYAGVGTKQQPLKIADYDLIVNTSRMAPGLALALQDLDIIEVERALSEEEHGQLKNMVKDVIETYQKSKNVIRELKLIMREQGIGSMLKKWLNNAEVDALMKALSEYGSVKGRKIGHGGRVKIDANQSLVIPWGYYRLLKAKVRDKTIHANKAQWETYTPDRANALVGAIQNYPKMFVMRNDGFLKKLIQKFSSVSEQKDWQVWFEKNNNDITFELLFDYLCLEHNHKDDQERLDWFKQQGISAIKARRFLTIMSMYAKTSLCASSTIV